MLATAFETDGSNVEALDEIDPDMTHAAVVTHYLVDVVLPSRSAEPEGTDA